MACIIFLLSHVVYKKALVKIEPIKSYVELLNVGSSTLVGWDRFDADDLNGRRPGTMSGAHVNVCNTVVKQ